MPSFSKRFCTSGSASAALTAAVSFSATSGGASFGAYMLTQVVIS